MHKIRLESTDLEILEDLDAWPSFVKIRRKRDKRKDQPPADDEESDHSPGS